MVYCKHISASVAVQLALDDTSDDQVYADVTFVHRGGAAAPVAGENGRTEPAGWLSGLWSGTQTPPVNDDSAHFTVGYVQVVGCVVTNYRFPLAVPSLTSDSRPPNASWWGNAAYAGAYANRDDDDDMDEVLEHVPFIEENSAARLLVGNKLGGINDLTVDKDSGLVVDAHRRYFVQDLLYNFDTYKMPADDTHTLPLKDVVDNVLPFYTTSQTLLFTDLEVAEGDQKTFHLKFPKLKGLPPSYNTRSTGVKADQGAVSIKYFVVVGFQKMARSGPVPVNVYFPLHHRGERVGSDDRWLQHDYLQKVVVDKSWKALSVDEGELARKAKPVVDEGSKETFLQDLDTLIRSDLYNMPKVSTHERKKSAHILYDHDEIQHGLVPQLPAHMKNQFSILVNKTQLCLLELSKPYYHLGENLSFTIHLNTRDNDQAPNRIVGVVAHLEAHEIFHVPKEINNKSHYPNIYKVSPNIKFNALATTLLNSQKANDDQSPSVINGYINIPRHLSQQFQSSKFMDLKYFVVFKFNLMKFDKAGPDEPQTNDEDLAMLPTVDLMEVVQDYRVHNVGTEFRFRLPVPILP